MPLQTETTVIVDENASTEETMEYEEIGEVQYVYDENQMILGGPEDFNNITDLVLEDGTRAMIVNGTLVTADGQTLILQDDNDLSQYYVDENTDHILLSQEQEEQFLEIISSQNPQTENQVVEYVKDGDNHSQIEEKTGQQVLYIQDGDQVLPVQEEYQLAEVDLENNRMQVPMQVVKLENDQVIEGIDGVIDLEQFLSQQGLVQLEGQDGNYQYAVLKDGKFHIQTISEPTKAEALKDPNICKVGNDNEILGSSNEVPFSSLSGIKGKNVKTGESISLTKPIYNKNIRKNLNFSHKKGIAILKSPDKLTSGNISNDANTELKKLINRKITIGKTDNGKLLVGKIINVTKKTDASTHIFDSDKGSLEKNVIKRKIVIPPNEKPKNVFNITANEVINLVDNEETNTVKFSDKNRQQTAASSTRTSIPKTVCVPTKTGDQNGDKPLTSTISSNSGPCQSSNSSAPSILKPHSATSPIKSVIPECKSQYSTPKLTTIKKEELHRLTSEKEDYVKLTNPVNDETPSIEQSRIVVHKKVVTKDCFEVITRTLTGLMNLESVVKKLRHKTIIIKIIEKTYDYNIGDYSKSVSYCTGYMVREYKLEQNFSESWRFIPDTNAQDTILGEDNLEMILTSGQNDLKKIANLTIQITINPQGSRTTRVIINPPNMYKCKNCPKSFRTSSALKVHINDYHPLASCESNIRSRKFKLADESEDHSLSLEIDDSKGMYECMECNKRFMSSLLLRKHMDMHFKPMNCQVCNQSFSTIKELKKHTYVHTPAVYQPSSVSNMKDESHESHIVTNIKPPEPKIYGCDICGRQFSRHSNLQRHIEIHQGEGAMYKCAICNCSYHYVSSLTRHVVTCHVDTAKKRLQKFQASMTKPVENADNTEFKFLPEDQIIEMTQLEDVSSGNLQYASEAMDNVTESLIIGEGVQVLQIPVDEGSIIQRQ